MQRRNRIDLAEVQKNYETYLLPLIN